MIEFILNYWIQVVFGAVLTFLAYLWKKVKKYYESLEETKDGIRILLKHEIVKQYLYYINQNDIDLSDIDAMNQMLDIYHKLGGNGLTNDMSEKLENLLLTENGRGD